MAMRWGVAAMAVLLAGCMEQGIPGEGSFQSPEPFCGEDLEAYNQRAGAIHDWVPTGYRVRVDRHEDQWTVLFIVNATFAVKGEVQMREAGVASLPIWQSHVDVGNFCDREYWTVVPNEPATWVLTFLHDSMEVTLSPEVAFTIAANETDTTVARHETLRQDDPGNITETWPGPWFNAWGGTDPEYVVAYGDAFSLIGIRASLPAAIGGIHNVRLVPLEGDWRRSGQDPWLDANMTHSWDTVYRVIAPPDGNGRIGVQADWPFQEYPTYEAGAYCWVLTLRTTDHVEGSWQRNDGVCH